MLKVIDDELRHLETGIAFDVRFIN